MFALYRQSNSDAEFKYLHVYKRIDKCEKWAEVRRTLDKAKETYKPDAPTPGASEGRPNGKGAKKGKHADAATARVQESIEHCLAEAWKVVCLDPITGTNQSVDTYWERIKAEFDERNLVDPYFKGVYM